jgi:hypothetical protein
VLDASTAHRIDPDWTYGFPEMTEGQAGRIAAARTWRDHGWGDLPGSGESNSSIFSTTGMAIAVCGSR